MLADENGNVTDTYDYDAFGNLTNSTGNTSNNYRYCGEQFDGTTGLYYLRARYMNPNTGTFISMDSYNGSINDPVSLHKYLYANANPVMYSDPSGYISEALENKVSMVCNAILETAQVAYNAMCMAVCKDLVIGIAAVAVAAVVSYLLYELVSYYINDIAAGYETSDVLIDELIHKAIDISINFAKTYNPDPYARPGQKKQGREKKEKKKEKDWEPKNNKRRTEPPKRHTPGREHRKYDLFIPEIIEDYINDYFDNEEE